MKGLMGKTLLAAAAAVVVVGALAVTRVAPPVWAQDRGVRELERNRVVIDGLGGSIGVSVRIWSHTTLLTSSSVAPSGSAGGWTGSLPMASPSAPAIRTKLPST